MKETGIAKGDYVKVRLIDKNAAGYFEGKKLPNDDVVERLWCKVLGTNVQKQTLKLQIDNMPICPNYKFGEILEEIPVSFVLDHQERK